MKKIITIALVMMLVLTVVACAAPQAPAPAAEAPKAEAPAAEAPAKKQYVFGFSSPTMNNPFFLWIEQNARRTIEGNGDKMITMDPQLDPQKQISQVEDLLMQNLDCMILCPYDSASIKNALVACQNKNVPVIIYDTPVLDPDLVVTTVASDNVNAGFVVGEDMKKILKQGDEVAILHSPLAQTCVLRVEGFMKSAGDYFKIVGEWEGKGDTAASMLAAEDVIQGNPNLKAFFAINDPSAIGAVQAIESANKTGQILVWGVDGAPEAKHAIKGGTMMGSGAQSPKNIGEIAVEAAYKHLKGETLPADTVVETFIINKDNVDQFDLDGWQ